MRVAVIGGNRFVGRRVVKLLLQSGDTVTVVHRSPPLTPGAVTIQGDRDDPAVLVALLSTEPEAVLDMSLYNENSARILVEAFEARPLRYLAVSSAAIYSQRSPLPWNEMTRIEPAPGWGHYGVGKAEADAAVLASELTNALVVRPPYVIGAGDPDKRCELVFSRRAMGVPAPFAGDGSSLIQTIDADDMAPILIELLKSRAVGAMNIPGIPPISVKDFTEECVAVTGYRFVSQEVGPAASEYRPDLFPFPNLNLWVEGKRFRETCSIRPRPLSDTLEKAWREWRETAMPTNSNADNERSNEENDRKNALRPTK